MTKSCNHCSSAFEISPADLAFYEKVSPVIAGKRYDLPPPTLCPDCRQQRRFAWRNERHLYHRKCDKTGKSMITNYSPESGIKIYCPEEWWGDRWDARDYGRDFDFNRPFFTQFAELQKDVPQLGLSVWNCENCDFCNYAGDDKSCYLLFGSVYCEDCYYGSPYYSKDCVDTLVVRECERCYECIDCRKLHTCFYSQDCHSSNDLIYCFDLQGCSECIGCAGLRNKKFCIFNEQLSEAEYRKRKAELDLCVPAVHDLLREKLRDLTLRIPHRYMQSNQVQDVSGNYVYQCKNVHDSYYADRSEDCRYCAQTVDLKDCYDSNYNEEGELLYEYFGGYQNNHMIFSKLSQSAEGTYCGECHHSQHLFGCIGIQRQQYCILNKQYTKEQYEALVPQIIAHMQKTHSTSSGQAPEWGEFFPVALSPFGYNESVANEYFPLSREEVESRKWRWYEEENADQYLGPEPIVPSDIASVSDDICEKILRCSATSKLYKIIPQELAFYREMHLPIPRLAPNERHRRRLAMRNPRRLWDRACEKCSKAIRTSYAPDRPEKVYCDECYLKEVY